MSPSPRMIALGRSASPAAKVAERLARALHRHRAAAIEQRFNGNGVIGDVRVFALMRPTGPTHEIEIDADGTMRRASRRAA